MQLLRSLSALVVINIIITTMSASIVELKLTYNTDKNVINSSNNTKYIDRQHLYTVSRKKVPPPNMSKFHQKYRTLFNYHLTA